MCKKSFSSSSVKTAWSTSLVLFSEYPHSQAALATKRVGQYLAGERNSPQLNSLKRETAKTSHGKAPNVDERNMLGGIITANDYG